MKSVDGLRPNAVRVNGDANVVDSRGAACDPSSGSGLVVDAMPVTVRYSATLDRTYEEADVALIVPSPASPTPTDSSRASGCSTPSRTDVTTASSSFTHDGDFGFPNRTNSVDSLDDSLSSGGGHSRQISSDSTEFIPTRTIKTNTKPAFNPLQFIKTGRSVLVQKAEQQIKQFEEVKKVKERVREDEEAWQSNLDNWKSKRRQISSQKFPKSEAATQREEPESIERQGKKSKTFSEMMEERSKRGPSTKLPLYNDWSNEESSDGSGHDGTDGPGASKATDRSFESSESDHTFEDDLVHQQKMSPMSSATLHATTNGTNGSDAVPETVKGRGRSAEGGAAQEYTFEKAIQSYTQYAESRVKSHRPASSSSQAVDPGHLVPTAVSPSKTGGDWETNGPDTSSVLMDTFQRPQSNGRSSSSPNETKSSTPDLSESLNAMKLDRAEGQELLVMVSLRRGTDNKDFGFSIKSVRGFGTGIFVETVHPQSPAESAGLRMDDEILAINGEYCNSKRTHSAIVFAIKQAVYTGCLELAVYRYQNTDFLHVREPLSSRNPLGAFDSGQLHRSTSDKIAMKTVSGSQLSPAKVDVIKRRSLFESSASPQQSPEKVMNRRSLDVSTTFKDKLASFQSLESAADGPRPDRQQSSEREPSFKEKLASFQSLDSLERSAPPPSWMGDAGRQKSFESLSRSQDSNKRREDQTFQPFERTRSCEFLDFDCPANVLDLQACPRSMDPYPTLPNPGSVDHLPAPNREQESGECISREVLNQLTPTTELADVSHHHASGFELAASLEETPITGSLPSSPLNQKVLPLELDTVATDQIGDYSQLSIGLEQSFPDTLDMSFAASLDSEVVVVDDADVPVKQLEPPKEKPPPPPVEQDGLDEAVDDQVKKDEFIRMNSTKRIRKEIWKRRSDFLGIDPEDVQNFIQNEISQVSPPPNVGDLLREQLDERSGPRQEMLRLEQERSELLAKAEFAETGIIVGTGSSAVGHEEEIAQKEREIIENLEWEECQRWRDDVGHQSQFEQLDRFSLQQEVPDELRSKAEPPSRPEDNWKLKQREAELQRQEELLRMEKEKLRREQEELLRQKEEYQRQISHHHQQRSNPVSDPGPTSPTSSHSSSNGSLLASPIYDYVQPSPQPDGRPRIGPPPPPPSKPKLLVEPEPSRIRSNERSEIVAPVLQPLTKQTLYALSASPKAKLLEGDQWMVARRKTDGVRHDNYNQHWLVQEAEFRRLHPQQNGVERSDQAPQSPTAQWNGASPPSRPPPLDLLVRTTDQQRPPMDRWRCEAEPKTQSPQPPPKPGLSPKPVTADRESQMLSVSGKKKCSHCGDELGRGAAMIIESLQLFYHINCFKCCVCHVQLGNGSSGADVRVRSQKLHCHNCYSNDEGLKFSKV